MILRRRPFYCPAGMLPDVARAASEILRNKNPSSVARITDKRSAWLRHRHTFLLFEDHRETRALIAKYLRKSRYFAFMPLQ
jgi:hypothetical protein